MYIRNMQQEKDVENISNPCRNSRLLALDSGMRGQPQFSVRVLIAHLSDQTPTSEQHGRGAARVKAHDRFAAHDARP